MKTRIHPSILAMLAGVGGIATLSSSALAQHHGGSHSGGHSSTVSVGHSSGGHAAPSHSSGGYVSVGHGGVLLGINVGFGDYRPHHACFFYTSDTAHELQCSGFGGCLAH